MHIPYSEACERNKDPILAVLEPHFDHIESVLEIGTGTGQHAIHFAAAKPHLRWQTSDQDIYIDGIEAQLVVAKTYNVMAPLVLNVNQEVWVDSHSRYDMIYTANTFHIMSESDVQSFFKGLEMVIKPNAILAVYGPFKYENQFTSASNADFDGRLRSRGVGSAIKDFEWVNRLANDQGFLLIEDHTMPANNQCLVWRHAAN